MIGSSPDVISFTLTEFFFFFQAEDGIRDYKVTGVQTCALPIFLNGAHDASFTSSASADSGNLVWMKLATFRYGGFEPRSEERRVGKEGGGRREGHGHEKKKLHRSEGHSRGQQREKRS